MGGVTPIGKKKSYIMWWCVCRRKDTKGLWHQTGLTMESCVSGLAGGGITGEARHERHRPVFSAWSLRVRGTTPSQLRVQCTVSTKGVCHRSKLLQATRYASLFLLT